MIFIFHKSASCPNFLQRKLDISYVKIFDLDIKSYNETQRIRVWKCEIKTSMVSFRQTILFQKYKFLHATIFTRKVPQTPDVIHVTYFLIIKITPPPKDTVPNLMIRKMGIYFSLLLIMRTIYYAECCDIRERVG